MRKVFIDCGGWIADSVDVFKKSVWYTPDVIIYSFEPNPRFRERYKQRPDVIFIEKAVWIRNEEKDFYMTCIRGAQGSSLIKGKKKTDQKHPIKVQCLDFSKWILDTFTKDDRIVLKMDIEGAEYDVLNKMIKDKSINLIQKAFIEFHGWMIRLDKKIDLDLRHKLEKINGLKLLPEMKKYLSQLNKNSSF